MTSNETSTVFGIEDSLMRQCSHVVTAQVSTPPASDSFSVPEVIVRITTKFSVLSRAIKSTVWLLRAKRFLQGRVQDKGLFTLNAILVRFAVVRSFMRFLT